jgi:hypothetical protein
MLVLCCADAQCLWVCGVVWGYQEANRHSDSSEGDRARQERVVQRDANGRQ